jgi:transposase
VDDVLAGCFLDQLPVRLIGDKAYDSDPLAVQLRNKYGIEMIAPNRRNRCICQDGRKQRRYRRRWKVERLFAWMHNFRRPVTRGSITLKTSLDLSAWHVFICFSDIYETSS